MPFEFIKLDIQDVILIKPKVFGDKRGAFLETYKRSDFIAAGIKGDFIQDNLSSSSRGVLRGLHYQIPPHAQGKLIYCLSGNIFDVVVDIRNGSPTYGKWISEELSDENRSILYIPPGFAHGFCALSDHADVMYKCTKEYAPGHDRGIIWNDPDIGIEWPVKEPILSERDSRLGSLANAHGDFAY